MIQKTLDKPFTANTIVNANINAIEYVYIQFEANLGSSFSYDIHASREEIEPTWNALPGISNPHFQLEAIEETNSSTAGPTGNIAGPICKSFKLNTDGVRWIGIVVTSVVGTGRIKFFTS